MGDLGSGVFGGCESLGVEMGDEGRLGVEGLFGDGWEGCGGGLGEGLLEGEESQLESDFGVDWS